MKLGMANKMRGKPLWFGQSLLYSLIRGIALNRKYHSGLICYAFVSENQLNSNSNKSSGSKAYSIHFSFNQFISILNYIYPNRK